MTRCPSVGAESALGYDVDAPETCPACGVDNIFSPDDLQPFCSTEHRDAWTKQQQVDDAALAEELRVTDALAAEYFDAEVLPAVDEEPYDYAANDLAFDAARERVAKR